MARLGNYPTTYEQRKSFSIADLRKWGYLLQGTWKSGTIHWSRNGTPIGSISISSSINLDSPHVSLTYTFNNEKDVTYDISLVKITSNLKKGHIWYFRCPYTNKLCRKLYLIDGYFMHREATRGFYDKQIQSKHYRNLEKVYGPVFLLDKLYQQLYSKHFRKSYKGKPTKRYAKILAQFDAASRVDERDFLNAMIRR